MERYLLLAPHRNSPSTDVIEERSRLEGRIGRSTQGRHVPGAGMCQVGEVARDSGDLAQAVVLSRESLARVQHACLEGLTAVAADKE